MEKARQILAADGFKWSHDGALRDPQGRPVEFSILTSNNNPERLQMATLIQADLKQIGMRVNVVPLEFRSLVERVQTTREYEGCILSLASPDADPNPDMSVWLSSGGNHLWNPEQKTPATPWEAEIDAPDAQPDGHPRLCGTQTDVRPGAGDHRREPAASAAGQSHLLAGAKRDLANFQPALIEPYTLWNVDRLFWREAAGARK